METRNSSNEVTWTEEVPTNNGFFFAPAGSEVTLTVYAYDSKGRVYARDRWDASIPPVSEFEASSSAQPLKGTTESTMGASFTKGSGMLFAEKAQATRAAHQTDKTILLPDENFYSENGVVKPEVK